MFYVWSLVPKLSMSWSTHFPHRKWIFWFAACWLPMSAQHHHLWSFDSFLVVFLVSFHYNHLSSPKVKLRHVNLINFYNGKLQLVLHHLPFSIFTCVHEVKFLTILSSHACYFFRHNLDIFRLSNILYHCGGFTVLGRQYMKSSATLLLIWSASSSIHNISNQVA